MPSPVDDELRAELLRRVQEGHRAFAEVEQLMAKDPAFAAEVARRGEGGLPLVLFDWSDAPEPFRSMVAVDIDNSEWFARVVAKRGWPGVALAGQDGADAAWELAMHADTAQHERVGWLSLIDDAARLGDVPDQHAEYLRLRTAAVAAMIDHRSG